MLLPDFACQPVFTLFCRALEELIEFQCVVLLLNQFVENVF